VRRVALLFLCVATVPTIADEAEDDAAFFEFLGSFDTQDDEMLDALLLEDVAVEDDIASKNDATDEDQ